MLHQRFSYQPTLIAMSNTVYVTIDCPVTMDLCTFRLHFTCKLNSVSMFIHSHVIQSVYIPSVYYPYLSCVILIAFTLPCHCALQVEAQPSLHGVASYDTPQMRHIKKMSALTSDVRMNLRGKRPLRYAFLSSVFGGTQCYY